MDPSIDSLIADAAKPAKGRQDALIDPLVGTHLGNYEVLFVIGKGAYGTVYKAQDAKLGRFVAIKFLHEFLDARHEAMFLQEAKAIAALGKHPCIVQIFEYSEYQGRNYFVLEFVGSNAAMLLKVNRNGLAPDRAARIALDCADALAHAHKAGILHRDVKPANLLLEIDGSRAKLADFGVAHFFDAAAGGAGNEPGGTPGYMAPEIIRGGVGDARSDVFSLGITLYEMLSGRKPIEEKDPSRAMVRMLQESWPPLRMLNPDLPGTLCTLVDKALIKDPENRLPSAEAFAAELRAFLSSRTVTPVLKDETISSQDAVFSKTRAYKAAEDAKKAGADKLAYGIFTTAIEAFRDGEAYERLKQFASAQAHYDASYTRFMDAEQRAGQVMAEIRALKAAQHAMEVAKETARRAEAETLAPAAFEKAAHEEEAARKTPGLQDATCRYARATELYLEALGEARRIGEEQLVEPRKELETVRRKAVMLKAPDYAPEEWGAAEALFLAIDGTLPDFQEAQRLCQAAIVRYHETVRVTVERRRLESEKEARDPIVVAGIELAWIPPGSFTMGQNNGPAEEQPEHAVTISHGFWMGKYPITQGQWKAIMGENPSGFQGDERLPVESVSWEDCKAFIEKLNAMGLGVFRLPTEAEWEYACRAGSTGRWCFGDDGESLGDYAWTPDNAAGRTHPAGEKRPNAWGLHDLHGNVCEWCEDRCHSDYQGAPMDGSAWVEGEREERVTRGGSWCILTPECGCAYRSWFAAPDMRVDFMGVRIVRNK
ncbi:MAG TPA: bifunctional serine/threonine-protein kinase/formylglycine-generating enzyme family protein [Candidatus Hydrogenedentes bacterium]|nr:bifunctional serine/threonine-protein kinase/formylglycine-generating enzyme family protein [Candidatus Hydrogenedentota bacterium]